MKAHPRFMGITPRISTNIYCIYTFTEKLQNIVNNHSHDGSKDSSKDYYSQQNLFEPKLNIKMSEKFDIDVFNQIYEEK